jgi:hypothetical protein
MAHLQPQIPERVEHGFDHLLRPAGLLPGRDEGDVDIGIERHLAAPVAADGDQRHALRGGRVVQRVEPLRGEIIQAAKQLIGEEGVSGGGLVAVGGLGHQACGDLCPATIERQPQAPRRLRAHRGGITQWNFAERIGKLTPIDDGAAVGESFETIGHGGQIGTQGVKSE